MAKLTINEAAQGYTHKFAFDYVDLLNTSFLSNLGAAGQKAISVIAPGDIIDKMTLYLVTAPAGALTDLTLDVGNQTNDPDEFLDAVQITNMGTVPVFNGGGTGYGEFLTAPPFFPVNATTVNKTMYAEFNPATGLTALTAGAWVLAWRQVVAPRS